MEQKKYVVVANLLKTVCTKLY